MESIGDISEFKAELKSMGHLKSKEINVIVILCILFVLWIILMTALMLTIGPIIGFQ
jgi:hypothetical protein